VTEFTDQVVIITGAAGNLGGAIAYALDEVDATLALFDNQPDRLQEVCGALAEAGKHLLIGSVDVTDESSIDHAVQQVLDVYGRIDGLVNVAGGYRAGEPLHLTPPETWDFMLNLNARSVFLACRVVVPVMLERGSGVILNIGARPGLKGVANASAYSASKSAVIRLTESLSQEVKHQRIRVNCILPGTIDTPQNREAIPDAHYERWVKPSDIGRVALFLMSDAATGIHGAAIPVYGTG
jgi:NAD(P)-dependent dehydrogenase (short-subunit alcohol dehydrogenase family)